MARKSRVGFKFDGDNDKKCFLLKFASSIDFDGGPYHFCQSIKQFQDELSTAASSSAHTVRSERNTRIHYRLATYRDAKAKAKRAKDPEDRKIERKEKKLFDARRKMAEKPNIKPKVIKHIVIDNFPVTNRAEWIPEIEAHCINKYTDPWEDSANIVVCFTFVPLLLLRDLIKVSPTLFLFGACFARVHA